MRRLTPVLVVFSAVAAAAPLNAAASVGLISITPSVQRGGVVSLSIDGVPFGDVCAVRVHKGLRVLAAPGLGRKSSEFLLVRWSWKVPANVARGVWSVDVSCGPAGALHTSYTVR